MGRRTSRATSEQRARAPQLAKQARGRWGEDLAARHYERTGYEVLDRNWRGSAGEIDLIARRGAVLVICEVKARRNADFGPPAAAVTPTKQQRLRRLAAEWLHATGIRSPDIRFDVVAVTGVDVDVIEGAF